MEKIYKLLTCKSVEDLKIGINLLLSNSDDYIVEFFKKYGEFDKNILRWDIKNRTANGISKYLYADVGDSHVFIIYNEFIRLRPRTSSHYNIDIDHVSKEDYLNNHI